jgi:protein SOK2
MLRERVSLAARVSRLPHVVKIGPMHLKGVWIPFERALDFANREKITEMLYPLFVHNIGALLYHPHNQSRMAEYGNGGMDRGQERDMRGGIPGPGMQMMRSEEPERMGENGQHQQGPNGMAPRPLYS